MENKEQFYTVFGELLYWTAIADGVIQKEELAVIEQKIANHPYGKTIQRAFDVKHPKKESIDSLYQKVMAFCEAYGPNREYKFLVEVLEDVAKASDGIIPAEAAIIQRIKNKMRINLRFERTQLRIFYFCCHFPFFNFCLVPIIKKMSKKINHIPG